MSEFEPHALPCLHATDPLPELRPGHVPNPQPLVALALPLTVVVFGGSTARVLYPMPNTLPSLPRAQRPPFLYVLTELASSNPHLFRPHIPALLTFLPSLLLPRLRSRRRCRARMPKGEVGPARMMKFARPHSSS